MLIKQDDLSDDCVIGLLREHLSDMYATSPPESVHALDIPALKAPNITFFSAWQGHMLAGCVALKKLNSTQAELKSMRTAHGFRNQGVASRLLSFIVNQAKEQGYESLWLETGTQDYFAAARQLYTKFGFELCGPFSDYQPDPNSCFMRRKV
ncbi:GNAT family N-acetyltransferase [Alteromonas aestuariivivens]|uniref:GNAT family N-acetyltransferase n=1 Tax=Alteromonas aestuariivivens TaxID=1938339 RepID=A0A3D8M4U5_9ALTE|nr:GNAT family N-acetyltransferase [Alteromonas aestuariivivens]